MRRFVLTAVLFLVASNCYGAVELDGDANGATDISKGGTNATTAEGARAALGVAPVLGANDNYVTDDEKVVIGNTSGTNTGDQTASDVAITDTGTYYTGTNVEGALQEAGLALAGKLDAGDVTTVSTDVETFLGSANLAAMLTNLGIPGLSATTGPVVIVGNAGGSSQVTVPNATVNLPAGDVVNRTASETLTNKTLSTGSVVGTGTTVPVTLMIAASDETTAITAAAGKRKFRAPYAFTLTGVRCSVGTAPTGANLIIDVNETGTTSVLATKVTIEDGEYSSVDATAQPVIGDPGIADNADMSIDFDQVGSTIAGDGVKCTLYGTRVLP